MPNQRLILGSGATGSASAVPARGPQTATHHCAWTCLGVLFVGFVSGGATCARRPTINFAPPTVFHGQPTMADISAQVNRSLAIKSLESNTLTITTPEIMTKLRGKMKWERPHNFSLQAVLGSAAWGTALAAGSNSDMFWLQTQSPSPPTLYYASYEQFENQLGARDILPVSPLWLREALGVVELDPSLVHEGPIVRPDGKLEVRSYLPSPRGAYRRVIVLDAKSGTIVQTLLYDQTGKLIADAQQLEHEYYSAIDWSLPHKVNIQLIPDDPNNELRFSVEVGFYMINEMTGDNATAFTLPDATGLTTRNLIDINSSMGAANASPPAYTNAPPYRTQGSVINYGRVIR